jgi:hypothetical protein
MIVALSCREWVCCKKLTKQSALLLKGIAATTGKEVKT